MPEALQRRRGLGPTQELLLEKMRASEGVKYTRAGLEVLSGLTQAQVRSALRGLERRALVTFTREHGHRTAARMWSAAPAA